MPTSGVRSVELVITAPPPYGAALAYRTGCRTTLGALTQVIVLAQRQVIIAAPFLQAGHGLSQGPLADALKSALKRGVSVDVVSTRLSLETLNTEHFSQGAHGRLRLFRPQSNIADERLLGSHAKFCVSDGEWAYIGSANLTAPGLASQLEMGLLVQGDIARHIREFWEYALELGLFQRTE
jgi:phosphatidylserine/phosphatidylglycerophosphate/cardiolipin synthase-like enzyme